MATDAVQQLLKRYAGFKEELRQKNDYISSLENINELLYEKGRKDTLKIQELFQSKTDLALELENERVRFKDV